MSFMIGFRLVKAPGCWSRSLLDRGSFQAFNRSRFELWWRRRRKEWAGRTQALPALDAYRHTLWLGWNERLAKRREEVRTLVEELGRGR